MATITITPLHLSGNCTEKQTEQLKASLDEAARKACETALDQLDQKRLQAVLDLNQNLQAKLIETVVEIIHGFAISDKYQDEQVSSVRNYPPTYKVRPIEAQVTELRKLFPALGPCLEKLGRRPLPAGAEGWFALPRWQALAPSYNEAVEMAVAAIASRRRFSNRLVGRVGATFLRQSERSKLAEDILAGQQPDQDILVIPAQAGMLHRGCSARRARVIMEVNEFALGVFATASILLTHPERISTPDTLMIDCGGDEYSFRGNHSFDRVPLFDFDIGGIEFSVFYEDRARNLWGTPSAFVCKFS